MHVCTHTPETPLTQTRACASPDIYAVQRHTYGASSYAYLHEVIIHEFIRGSVGVMR